MSKESVLKMMDDTFKAMTFEERMSSKAFLRLMATRLNYRNAAFSKIMPVHHHDLSSLNGHFGVGDKQQYAS